ncbi:MAG: hypothetical protein LUD48_05645 [Prevotella sp.]|nr:hypothetical protein [Prevotella sp.]
MSAIDIHVDKYIDKLKLKNHSGTACSLEVCVKLSETGPVARMGTNKNISLGCSEELDLNKLGIKDEVYVTPYVNVSLGDDSQGKMWFKYKNGVNLEAMYAISGVVNNTKVIFCELNASE